MITEESQNSQKAVTILSQNLKHLDQISFGCMQTYKRSFNAENRQFIITFKMKTSNILFFLTFSGIFASVAGRNDLLEKSLQKNI